MAKLTKPPRILTRNNFKELAIGKITKQYSFHSGNESAESILNAYDKRIKLTRGCFHKFPCSFIGPQPFVFNNIYGNPCALAICRIYHDPFPQVLYHKAATANLNVQNVVNNNGKPKMFILFYMKMGI